MNELTFYFLIVLNITRIIGIGISIDFFIRTKKQIFQNIIIGWVFYLIAGVLPFFLDLVLEGVLYDLILLSNVVCASIGSLVIVLSIISYFIEIRKRTNLIIYLIPVIIPILLYPILGINIAISSSLSFMFLLVFIVFFSPFKNWQDYKKKVGASISVHFSIIVALIFWFPFAVIASLRGLPYGLYYVDSSFNGYVVYNYSVAIVLAVLYMLYIVHLEYNISNQKLRESEERYRLIAENANDMIAIINAKMQVEYKNELIHQEFLGYSLDELDDTYILKFVHPDDIENATKGLQRILEKGTKVQELRLKRKDGSTLWLESRGRNFIDGEGNKKVLVISRDITERKVLEEAKRNYTENLEREVREKTDELRKETETLQKTLKELKSIQEQLVQSEKLASIGLLAAGTAHEINNPLMGIINYAEIIRMALKEKNLVELGEKPYTFLENIIKEGERIARIVGGLLSFAREDRGKYQAVNISDLLNSVIELLNPRFKREQIQVEFTPNMELPQLWVQPQNIQQVFFNILQNSIDAIEEKFNGQLIQEVKKISIETNYMQIENNEFIKIIIRDNGIGISEENLTKIFDPFFTTKRKTRETGVGLGLSVSYGIVQVHSGEITIKSQRNEFTSVEVILPIKPIHLENDDVV